jgi:hypothetical protein
MKIFYNKFAGMMFILLNILTIIIQILVILKILPYNIIGGGRSENYNSAFNIAIVSIVFLIGEIIFIITVRKYNKEHKTNIFIKIGLWILFSFFLLNLIGNILGKTLFEKIVMGIMCVIQIINIIIMVTENKKYTKSNNNGIRQTSA